MLSRQRSRSLSIPLLLVFLVAATFLLRTWALDSLPPGLWWDEASQGLDARDLLHGQFRVFFPRAEGKEPLYIFLTTPFVAAWDGHPFAVRLAGATLGAMTVLALYLAGRALWRDQPGAGRWVGLIAAALWAVAYWPQSMNRVGFQVNAFPIIITLAVVAWLNWVHRPTRRRAIVFGLLAGLTLATYLAARFTPLIWLILYIVLPSGRRRALRPTLLWVLLAVCVTAVPMGLHFALHPEDFANRASVFPLLRGDYGKNVLEPLLFSTKNVAGAFLGLAGDENNRHNLPGRPAFSLPFAVLFALGMVAAIVSLRRRSDLRGWTLLTWLLVLATPSVLSIASNPHYPRLFGALPAALLLTAWPLATLASRVARRGPGWRGVALFGVALLLIAEGVRTTHDYFVTYRQLDLYEAFNGDTVLLGERIQARPEAVAVVPVYGDATHVLDYLYPAASIRDVNVDEVTIAAWLQSQLGAGAEGQQVVVPVWNVEPQTYADAKQAVPFYLSREGGLTSEEHLRNFDLLAYQLGEHPSFDAEGNHVVLGSTFSGGVRLVDAHWGAAYPNQDRDSRSAEAGTRFWAVLTWQVDQPLASLRAAVDLIDDAGHRLSGADQQLLRVDPGPAEAPTVWQANTLVRTYHLIDVPATQLPGPVTLAARLYDGETLTPVLPVGGPASTGGSVVLDQAFVDASAAPLSGEPLTPARPLTAALPGGVTLLGLDDWPATVQPGSTLTLRLYWQADQPLAQVQTATISLGGAPVTATTQLPPDAPVGRPVHTYADLHVPPDIAPGVYPLTLGTPGGDGQAVELGEVEIGGRPRRFDAPALSLPIHATFGGQVSLLGTETPPLLDVAPGQPITVTLAWQALATPGQDLVRFVHLLNGDGLVVAQQDSRPCAGQCPSSSWLPGEVLLEDVSVQTPSDLLPGVYRLAVGWYDAATVQRLAATDATGLPIADNLLILPVGVRVE
ncbi:MAG: hypothetical protein R2844_05325 [Caldilineales bacterium]